MMLRPGKPLCLALVLVPAFIGGCDFGSIDSPTVWVASEMVNLTDRTAPSSDPLIFDADRGTVKLFAAANETVSFQLVVDGGLEGIKNLHISTTDLAGDKKTKIAAENVRIFRCLPIRVSRYPPWYLRLVDAAGEETNFYDPLVPIDSEKAGQPFNLEPKERMVFWVDVRVPRRTEFGRYAGTLRIRASRHEDWTARLDLKVYNFVLPDARPLAAVGGFDHAMLFSRFLSRRGRPFVPTRLDPKNPLVRRGLILFRQLMRLAHEHRLDLFDRGIHPIMKRDAFGKVRLDWKDYDSIVRPYLSGAAFEDRIGCVAWPVPFSESWPVPKHYGGTGSELYAETIVELLTDCRKHFSLMNAEEQVFLWPYRGRPDAAAYERYLHLARIARKADTETPILSQLPPDPPRLTGWNVPQEFTRLTNIFAPRGEWLDPARAAGATTPENPLAGVWLSPGTPPYLPSLGVIATPADVRAFCWFAMKYKCTGLFLPETLHWTDDIFAPAAGSETRLFYPGTIVGIETVLPSVRLKRLRRGLQDLAYLWVLQQRHREGIAQTIIDAMARYAGLQAVGDNYQDVRLGGWVQDAATWQMARRLLAEEVQAVVQPSEMSTRQLIAQRLAWHRFDERTHTVRVEQVRSRITLAGKNGPLRATVMLDLYNEHSREVDVRVKIEKLPPGWKAVAGEVNLSPLPAATQRIVILEAEGMHAPIDSSAKMRLPVSITIDKSVRKEIYADVPFLLAGRSKKPPTIDGKLDDWPIRVGNTAGKFKLIGRRGRSGAGLAKRQSLVFVLFDEKNLYVAFRCEEPTPQAIVAKTNNIIHYEQLMACGEDLVEVILDPGARAKGPEDLYHIVVKPNGVLVTERGVRSDPPLGRVRPWPASVSLAVGKQNDVWIVELAIPRSAFGQAGNETFWGVNFTRFATQGAEASSWSGSPRYFYDLKNLGTMFVTPIKKP